jgi:hypothetical protein
MRSRYVGVDSPVRMLIRIVVDMAPERKRLGRRVCRLEYMDVQP